MATIPRGFDRPEDDAHSLKFICPPLFTGGPIDPVQATRTLTRNLMRQEDIDLPPSVAAAAKSGRAQGGRLRAWIIDDNEDARMFPALIIRTVQGDVVHADVSFSSGPHTIHWHGIEPTPVNDGVGHTSFEATGSFIYQFKTHQAGTYFYHCHRNTTLHFENGLYGLLVVDPVNPGTRPDIGPAPYPTGGRGFVAAYAPQFPGFVPGANVIPYDVEAIWVVDEHDSDWKEFGHDEAMQICAEPDPENPDAPLDVNNPANFVQDGTLNDYVPDILTITGVFPGRLSGSFAAPPIVCAPITPTTPTDPDTTVPASIVAPTVRAGQTLLVRLLNAGYTWQEYTLELDAVVIAHDGHPFGIPDSHHGYSQAFAIPAGTPFRLSTARRLDLLIRPTTPGEFLFTAKHYDWQKADPAQPEERVQRGQTQALITVQPAEPEDEVFQPVILEAENAVLGGGTQVTNIHAGFTGTGFVSYPGPALSGQFIEWTVDVPTGGEYRLEFRYALATGTRPLRIDVNGALANASLAFPASGSWTTWRTVEMTVALNAGSNTVRATSIGSRGGNIDHLRVSAADADTVAGVGIVHEAEEAVLSGVQVLSVHPGFTGTGFASFSTTATSGQFIEWTVNTLLAGEYELKFRYALASGNRPLRIDINGQTAIASLAFPATGSWTTWRTVSAMVTLPAGVNEIRATSIGSRGANIDHMEVFFIAQTAPPPPVPPSEFYEAEDAVLGGGATVTAVHPGFTGTGFVSYNAPSGQFIEWTVNVPEAGLYQLEYRYALAAGNRPLRIDINNLLATASLAFPASGSWTTWRTVTMNATLNAGNNTIRATSIGFSGANMDHLNISAVVPPADGIYEAENALLGAGVQVLTVHPGFTGTGFANYTALSGQFIEWTAVVPSAGQRTLEFRYALAAGNRPLRIDVNGALANASLGFPATGGWATWQTVSMTATLNAGVNTIRATTIGFEGPNIDHLRVQ